MSHYVAFKLAMRSYLAFVGECMDEKDAFTGNGGQDMGRGNWIPDAHHRDEHYRMVYVNYPDFEEESEDESDDTFLTLDEMYADWYSDLICGVRLKCEEAGLYLYDKNNGGKIAYNGLIEVVTRDWDSYVAVAIVAREDLGEGNFPMSPELGRASIDRVARLLFDRLDDENELSVGCGPWTSGKYTRYDEGNQDAKKTSHAKAA